MNTNNGVYTKDVFDLLGISSREDSYTDLIVNMFNESGNEFFRDKICEELSSEDFKIDNTPDSAMYTRCVFNVKKTNDNGMKSKVAPDIILVSPTQKKALVIECKIFSGEGHKQTASYSSPDFISELNKWVNKNVASSAQYEVGYIYITLFGDKPSNPQFKPRKWTEVIINSCSNQMFSGSFNVLARDLLLRAVELDDFINSTSSSDKTMEDYLAQRKRWINNIAVFYKIFAPIFRNLDGMFGGDFEYTISNVAGRTPQVMVLFEKEAWKRHHLDGYTKGRKINTFEKTRDVHIELNWHVLSNTMALKIHHESLPYKPFNNFKSNYKELLEGYSYYKDEFKGGIHYEIDKNKATHKMEWEKTDTWITLAQTKMDVDELSIGELRRAIIQAVSEANEMIENII